MEGLYSLKLGALWRAWKRQPISFWCVSGYLFFEYVRLQSIVPAIDVLPWAQTFILLTVATLLLNRNTRWISDPANAWMIIYSLAILLSSLWAYIPERSLANLFDFFGWIVVYFAIIHAVNSRQKFFLFLLLFMLASYKLSAFGARSWAMRGFSFTAWGIAGPKGFFQNSGELAIQMLIFLGISYYYFEATKKYISGFRYLVVASFPVTALMTVLGASSRGGQLGAAVQLGRVLFTRRQLTRALCVSSVVLALSYMLLPDAQKQRFADIGSDQTSKQRLLYWKNGLSIVRDYPLFGIGYNNFIPYYENFYSADLLRGKGTAEHPHNIFVQVGAETGLLGLFAYVMIIVRGFASTRIVRRIEERRGRADSFEYSISRGLDLALIAFIVAGQFVSVAYYPFLWIHMAMVVSLKNIVARQYQALELPRKRMLPEA